MKHLLIIAMLLSGCTSHYAYHQVDDEDYGFGRTVTTHVTDTQAPAVGQDAIDFAVVSAAVVGLIAALAALGGGSE
jgi:hypothetical protein